MTLACILDARPAMRQGTGVGTYVEGLLSGFAKTETPLDLAAFTASWKDRPRDRLLQLAQDADARLVHRRIPVRALNWCWHQIGWPPVEWLIPSATRSTPDRLISHSPHPLLLPTRHGRSVVTVHDLYFLERPDQTFAEVRRDYPRRIARSLSKADAVICVSEHTRHHLLQIFGERLGPCLEQKSFVVPNGIDSGFFFPDEDAQAPGAEDLPRPYLAVGRIEARKNPERLLEAFARARTDAPLVWAGAPADDHWRRRVEEAVARLGLSDRVEILGYVDRSTLRAHYRNARGLLYPSLHEGFGLPILEAMACGCPVLTGDRTAMPEVAGTAALLVDPMSVDSIRAGIEELEPAPRRASFRAAGLRRVREFSWLRCAQQTLEIYQQI